jgi:aldehyde:ferredoxin oxidoreductase
LKDSVFAEMIRLDLTKETISKFEVTESEMRQYLGGTGLGAKILFDEVPSGVGCFDPENRLIIAAGPLNATPIGGSGSVSVVSKGPLTQGAGCSQANGFFGAFLRSHGLVGIVVQGASSDSKYLYIDTETVELHNADWLKSYDTYQTSDLLKSRHDRRSREMSVASIGIAGENKVRFAGVFFDYGHSASHNGLGAVMGSKGLKAIAIDRGKEEIQIKQPDTLRSIAQEFLENVKTQSVNTYEYGTLKGIYRNAARNMIPVKNYTTSKWKIQPEKWEKFSGEYIREKYFVRRNSCWACQIHHCDLMKITEGPYAGEVLEEPEYEQFVAWSSNIGNTDVAAAMMLSKEVDRLGLETNEAGWVVGFAMECYEKGILSKSELNELDLEWGNAEEARLLLNLIARKEGIGEILGEGVKRAAEKIGREAQNIAIHTVKGNTPRGHDHRNRTTEMFDTVISNTSTLETWGGPIALGSFPDWKDIVDANLNDKGAMMVEDSMVTCRFNTRMNVDLLSKALAAVTGWNYGYEEAMQTGRRIVHLLRAFNIRQGIGGREKDQPSKRYGSVPDAGEGEGKSLSSVWDKMLTRYYRGMGWNDDGKPLPETLKAYALDHIEL